MPCFKPMNTFTMAKLKKNGKLDIRFKCPTCGESSASQLPCGQCIGCRLERSRQWAVRGYHESQLYENNCFLTLTFNEENYPKNGSLFIEPFQLFMKKLRNYIISTNPVDKLKNPMLYKRWNKQHAPRFLHCGEYGDLYKRPHDHSIIFNFDFPDKEHRKNSKDGLPIYTSAILDKLWGKGDCYIGAVTFESIAYVARYITKKVNGKAAKKHYNFLDKETGETYDLKPEYITMSRKPGIGAPWLTKYKTDVYPLDEVVINGKRMKPPSFYDGQYEVSDPIAHTILKENRKVFSEQPSIQANNTSERLAVREKLKLLKIKSHVREIR